MMDREKIIKDELDGIVEECRGCDYVRFAVVQEHCLNIRAVLKEQEAVEPRRDAKCVRMFRCSACGEYVGFIDSDPGDPNEQDNYCRNCGRVVKWK